MNIWKILANNQIIIKHTPRFIKSFARRNFSVLDYDKYMWQQLHSLGEIEENSTYNSKIPIKLGIIKDFSFEHHHYVAACRELGVSYKILDISASNWIEIINNSNCDGFLVWPSSKLTTWRQMYDERLKVMVDDFSKTIYPSYKEIWLYENKRRVRDWLIANDIPHPKTEIFYDIERALAFIKVSKFPLVLKTNQGASSRGVFILENSKQALKLIKRIFRKGIIPERSDRRDRQWGSVILQEYLSSIMEWRLVRIGDSYFGHPKGRIGNFHSGSGKVLWDHPSEKLLNFLYYITEKGNFTSMDVDVFLDSNGKIYVNELQTVFGTSYSIDQLRINGKPGRFKFMNQWIFEKGDFARNACCNLRVKYLVTKLLKANGRTSR